MRGLIERGRAPGVTIAIPCRSDEPGLRRTLESLARAAVRLEERGHEVFFSICTNGAGGPARGDAHAFATGDGAGRTSVFDLEKADKVGAWNRLRGACETPWILFCDADVEPAQDALVCLAESMESRRDAAVATARLEPDLAGASWVARAAALPHRFDFGVVRGPLYLLRTEALARMPAGLLLEDAWLAAELSGRGAGAVLSVWSAVVRYRPAHTLADYFHERVRRESARIQLREERTGGFCVRGPVARYPWEHFLAEFGPREWPLVALNLGVHVAARAVAAVRMRRQSLGGGPARAGEPQPWTDGSE